jgi:sec-independent protein translocase protein TatC
MAHASRAHSAQTASMSIAEHLRELRRRLFIVAFVFLAASALAYYYRDPLLHGLLSPLNGEKLVYLNPAGGFNFIFLVSIYTGLVISMPVLISQLYSFIRPALPSRVRRHAVKVLISSTILLAAGVAFGYFLAIPGALRFLYGFAETYVTASLTADSYLNFVVAYTLGLGLVFQLPLLLLLLHWIKPLTPGDLLKSERWVILLAFIAAAFITPTPDPVNQTIIALPIIVVYQFGVIAILISLRKSRKQQRATNTRLSVAPVEATPTRIQTVLQSPQRPPASHPRTRLSVDGMVIRQQPRSQVLHKQ